MTENHMVTFLREYRGQAVTFLCETFLYRGIVSKVYGGCRPFIVLSHGRIIYQCGDPNGSKPVSEDDTTSHDLVLSIDKIETMFQPKWCGYLFPNNNESKITTQIEDNYDYINFLFDKYIDQTVAIICNKFTYSGIVVSVKGGDDPFIVLSNVSISEAMSMGASLSRYSVTICPRSEEIVSRSIRIPSKMMIPIKSVELVYQPKWLSHLWFVN